MRIGLVSFEYPPDTAVGGIATYTEQWGKLLKKRGHDVEVFCSSPTREGTTLEDGLFVHRCKTTSRSDFKNTILPFFIERNTAKQFDVVESPEYNADAIKIKQMFPSLTLVVKLHTPTFLMDKLNDNRPKISFFEKARVTAGAWRRFKKPSRYWLKHVIIDKEERAYINSADVITSPSLSLIDIVADYFKIEASRIKHLPNPYIPATDLLNVEVPSNSEVITYFGRLEKRKGIKIFAEVLPKVLAKYPNYKFRFVGKDTFIFPEGISAKKMLTERLESYNSNIEFIEHVSLNEIPKVLSDTAICVFPSLWENFPTVCLEAMSAGRAIVGSKEGGMSDMLQRPKAGILINPLNADEIAEAICEFIDSKSLRFQLGLQARKSVCEKYNTEIIGEAFEKLIAQSKR